jgi:UDP-N-acetylmuramyl pentapeptide phosphotransferase/UDP-N-acetylglucosamine-1-phosphate transferase
MFDSIIEISKLNIIQAFGAIVVSFILNLLIIPSILRISNRKHLFEAFGERKIHTALVPPLGGIGILLCTIIPFLIIYFDFITGDVIPVVGLLIILSIIGIADDLVDVSARKKLLTQLGIAIYVSTVLKIRIFSLEGFLGTYELGYVTSVMITIFLIIVIINSFNLIDGIDGLFGSFGIYISMFLGIYFFLGTSFHAYAILNFALVGSLMSFFLYNVFGRRNKIFAGAGGTQFVGLLLAVSFIKSINADVVSNSVLISLFAIPLFDTIRVMAIRVFQNRSPFSPDNSHIHHVVLKYVHSHLEATIIIVTYGLIVVLSVMFIPWNPLVILIIAFIIFNLVPYFLKKQKLTKFLKLNVINPFKSKTMSNNDTLLGVSDGAELFYSLRLKSNPFSRFSAEEEIDYLDEIYYRPKYFHPLFEDIRNGHSRFVFGARGVGKTALLLKLRKQLDNINGFTIIIDDYEGIPLENNSKYFLEQTIKKLVTGYCISLSKSPQLLKRLRKNDKEKLAFFIENFYEPITKNEFERQVNTASKYKSKNIWIKMFNFILAPFNSAISLGVEIGSDVIKKSFGLDSYSSSMVYKAYIKEIKQINPSKTIFIENASYSVYKEIISDISRIIKKSGFEQVVIMYDKIDEHKDFDGIIANINNFLTEILRDTSLLLNKDFGLVFALWSNLKIDLSKKGVRFDKISPIDVTWNNNELEQIINTRLKFLSINKAVPVTLEQIIVDSKSLEEIIFIANKSPRDLLRLISMLYYEQANINFNAKYFSTLAISKGIRKYVKEYDYYSIYPPIGKKDDIISNLEMIINCGKLIFKTSDFKQDLDISIYSAKNLVKTLLHQGVIVETNQISDSTKLYEVADPKIAWLIKNQINPWGSILIPKTEI